MDRSSAGGDGGDSGRGGEDGADERMLSPEREKENTTEAETDRRSAANEVAGNGGGGAEYNRAVGYLRGIPRRREGPSRVPARGPGGQRNLITHRICLMASQKQRISDILNTSGQITRCK